MPPSLGYGAPGEVFDDVGGDDFADRAGGNVPKISAFSLSAFEFSVDSED